MILKNGLRQIVNQNLTLNKLSKSIINSDDNTSFLHECVLKNYSSIISLLIKKNNDIELNSVNNKGETPLHLAIKANNISMIKLLLNLGAKITRLSSSVSTPLDILEEKQKDSVLKSSPSKSSFHIDEHSDLTRINSCRKFSKVQIQAINQNSIDDMFYEMRDYFGHRGHLLQKEITETINIKDSTVTSINKSMLEEKNDCDEKSNLCDSGTLTKKIPNIHAFTFKNQISPQTQRHLGSEGLASKDKVRFGFDCNQGFYEIDTKVGPKNFKVLRLLGVGSFGEVFLVEKKDNHKLYAMKVILKEKIFSRNLKKYAIAERNVLCVTSHPFIVKLYYAFQTEERLFLIIEYCNGGDLSNYLEAEDCFNENKARFYIAEIILAIEDLHKRGIIYRDLKPGNILLDNEGHVRLTDFGLSKEGMIMPDNSTQSFCGSYAYLAPEMIRKEGHSMSIDWYLVGVVLYELVQGLPPFYSNNKDTLMKNILENTLEIPTHHSK